MKVKCPKCGGCGYVIDSKYQGQLMRDERVKSGLMLRELARRMSYTASYISDLELGRRAWNARLIEQYRKCLKWAKSRPIAKKKGTK